MRNPDYEAGETIDDVADEAYDRTVQRELDAADALVAQPQACSFCPHIFAGPTCPSCNTERPTFTAMKNITAHQLKAGAADNTDLAYIARHCGAI